VESVVNEPRFFPVHGGDIQAASEVFDIPLAQWIDLSTGINPDGYSIPEIPPQFFARLPCDDCPPLQQAARAYYHVQTLLPGAGLLVSVDRTKFDHLAMNVGLNGLQGIRL
jgi:hypothetical protein